MLYNFLLTLVVAFMSTSALSRVALVTGSTDGIGKHTAKRLLEAGYKVLIHGRSESRVANTVNDFASRFGQDRVDAFVYDLTNIKDQKSLASDIKSKYDKLHLCINNAGVFQPSLMITDDGLESTFAINVVAPFVLSLSLLDIIKKADSSRIINISSISQSDGDKFDMSNLQFENGGFSDYNSYGLSKRCIAMFSMTLASKLSPIEDALVVSCDPGTVNTKMLLAGWGRCGIEVEDANTQFNLATMTFDEKHHGEYFIGKSICSVHRDVLVEANRENLWNKLEELTGLTL